MSDGYCPCGHPPARHATNNDDHVCTVRGCRCSGYGHPPFPPIWDNPAVRNSQRTNVPPDPINQPTEADQGEAA